MIYNIVPFILLSIFIRENRTATISPSQLTCEYLSDPSVVDISNPRLAWINKSSNNDRGQRQTAYQIRVASTEGLLTAPDLWDSEKVMSIESIRVSYQGKVLASRQECWWQVRVWGRQGNTSPWSEPAHWRMGLLSPRDWKAKWIGAPWQGEEGLPKPAGGPDDRPEEFGPPAPFLRKEFRIEKEVAHAIAYVTGLGYFELYANGEKVGKDVLVPNQTNYGKRPKLSDNLINVRDDFTEYKVMYLAYDLDGLLKKGENVIGSILGNGFYNPAKFWTQGYGSPRFLCQIHITYTDGTEDIIKSDTSWRVSKGPILMDMVYYGEHYDARKEIKDWASSSNDTSQWENAILRNPPEGELVAHTARPDRVTQSIPPVSIEKLGEGHFKVDFGVEISGWVKLDRVRGPRGHKVDISFNSNLYSGDNSYTFKGVGPETYEPRFNWFVFSGVEIKNWPGKLRPQDIVAQMVNTEIAESATFKTSNPLFNKINEIWCRSQLDNMHGGVASDCPHRERSPYTGDGQVACATVMNNFDAKNFYYKWIGDIRDAQVIDTGYVPNGAPWQPGCGGGVAWGAAICIMPWEFYIQYGARDILEDNYGAMKGYVKYMKKWVDRDGIMFSQRKSEDGKVLKWFNLGEWAAPGELVRDDLVHTFYFWTCADIVSKIAKVLGQQRDYEEYGDLAETTKKAFQKKFYNSDLGTYGNAGGNIFALKMGVPDSQYSKVKNALVKNIESNGGHLDTGIFGTRYFFETLAENGLDELAYGAMNKTDFPGFGHWVQSGSTTTREHWDEEGSHNHPMFGGGLVWLYRNLAGMRADPNDPGYRHIIFRPRPVADLDRVEYSNLTPYGKAAIKWGRENGEFKIDVTVPVGSTATIYVPTGDKRNVTESSRQIENTSTLQFKGMEENAAVYSISSGTYHFNVSDIQ